MNERRAEACRVVHWREMLRGTVAHPYRRPHDQDVRIAWVILGRCPIHRHAPRAEVPAVVGRDEEVAARSLEELHVLADGRLLQAMRTLKRAVVPFRFRREMGVAR